MQTFLQYDKAAKADEVARVYDLYAKPQAFERVPFVLAAAVKSVVDQQSDPQIAARMKAYDFHKVIDNSYVERLVKDGFFEKTFGAGNQGRGGPQSQSGLPVSAGRMVKLEVSHVSKRYWLEREGTEAPALIDVSFSVADGEFMAIVGPSGCGKTSLLNIIAGLLPYDEGSVSIDGRKIQGPGIDRAVVFQHSSLLPWRTIAGNVRYGMELQRRFDKATMAERTEYFIKLVGLSGFERHYPSELSGGMQQRVNLATGPGGRSGGAADG